MKKIDRLEARLNEKVKDPGRDIDFSYLTDEELERESFKLEKLNYEYERSEHPEWSDDEIFQKMEDDLIEIMEEWGKTPEETAEMRALIDRAGLVAVANGRLFSRKVGAAVAVNRRGGAMHVVDAITHMFLMSRMIVPGSIYWNFGVGLQPGEVENDTEAVDNMHDLGETIAWLVKRLRSDDGHVTGPQGRLT